MAFDVRKRETMEFINLTPHTIITLDSDGVVVRKVPPSGNVARVSTSQRLLKSVGGVDLYVREAGEVVGLPAPRTDTIYIVPTIVRAASPERHDLASPSYLDSILRRPIWCQGLVINR